MEDEGLSLHRLRVYVPGRHELALSKIIRAYQHDLETVEQIHAARPLDEQTIFERYERELMKSLLSA